jgi:hypothetical protein
MGPSGARARYRGPWWQGLSTLRAAPATGQTSRWPHGAAGRPATRPFAERPPSAAPRLWTTSPAAASAARNAAGFTGTVPAHFEYSTTCGVHNLWTKLLITMWGREVDNE